MSRLSFFVIAFVRYKTLPRGEVLECPRQEATPSARVYKMAGKGFRGRNELGLQANCGVTPIFIRLSLVVDLHPSLHFLQSLVVDSHIEATARGKKTEGSKTSGYSRTCSNVFCMCPIWTYTRAFAFSSYSLNLNTHHKAHPQIPEPPTYRQRPQSLPFPQLLPPLRPQPFSQK
jgi:hypothetical protein